MVKLTASQLERFLEDLCCCLCCAHSQNRNDLHDQACLERLRGYAECCKGNSTYNPYKDPEA